MDSKPETTWRTWWTFLKARSRPIGFYIGAMLICSLISAGINWISTPDYWVSVFSPERAISAYQTDVVASLGQPHDGKAKLENASVRVHRVHDDRLKQNPAQMVIEEGFDLLVEGEAELSGNAVIPISAGLLNTTDKPGKLLIETEVDDEVRWAVADFNQDSEPVLAIVLDRSLYKPGQSVKMRVLAADRDSGRPIQTPVKFEVRDSKDNLILLEEVTSSLAGIASTELPLANPCAQGNYKLTVTAAEVTQFKNFEVRPFRLPRFKVDVLLDQPSAEGGKNTTGQVIARYTYGDPVANADVTLTIASERGRQLKEETIVGKTSKTGSMDFSWMVPAEIIPGSTLKFSASVASAVGRAENGGASQYVVGGIQVELIPGNRARFLVGKDNPTYLILTRANSAPIAGAKVQLQLAEKDGERELELVTDANGRAKFNFRPGSSQSYASVKVQTAEGEKFSENVEIYTKYANQAIEPASPILRAQEPTTLRVDPADKARTLIAMKDGVPVHHLEVPAAQSQIDLTLPDSATGLTKLFLLDAGAQTPYPVWVQQASGDEVSITGETQPLRPGQNTSVQLAFQSKSESTYFGVVGVDEALYALKERADVSLPVLMRGIPGDLAEALSTPLPNDPDEQAIAGARVHEALTMYQSGAAQPNGRDITHEVENRRRNPFRTGWGLFLLVGLFGALYKGTRVTWETVSKSAFTWRRTGALLGSGLLALVFTLAVGLALRGNVISGAIVWSAVVTCWVLGAAMRQKDFPVDRWLALHIVVLSAATLIAVTIEPMDSGHLQTIFPVVAAITPLVVFGLQFIIWIFIAYREEERLVAFGFAAILGAMATLPFQMISESRGHRYDMAKEEMAPMMEPPMATKSDRRVSLSMGPPPGVESAPRVRSWFPETMLWVPEVSADGSGVANVSFEVPDSITTWRLNAWANTTAGEFGEGQMSMLVSQPFFVELDLPTDLTQGDTVDIPVSFVNKSEEALTLPLRVESTGSLRSSRLPNTISIPPGGRVVQWLEISALGIGKGDIMVSAGDVTAGDAVRRTAQVAPDGRTLTTTYSGMIDDGWVQPISMPKTIPDSALLRVEVYPSVVADALEGLQGMLNSPNGCFEQTSSTNFPNVMVLRTLRDVEPNKWPKWQTLSAEESWKKAHADATKLISLGYQKILTFQKSNGGFALYPTNSDEDLLLTAYGIIQLSEMQSVTTIDPRVIQRAAEWLVEEQDNAGAWPLYGSKVGGGNHYGQDIGQIRGVSFMALALIAANDEGQFDDNIKRALDHIEKRIDSAEAPDAIALAANALVAGKRKEAARKVVDRLLSSVVTEKDLAYWTPDHPTWMGGAGHYANVETTALAAYAMLETGAGAETLPRVLTYLASARSHRGGWGTTQATVWTLRTLERLGKKQNPAALEIYMDGDLLPRANGQGPLGLLQIDGTPQPVTAFHTKDVHPGNNLVTIVSDAPTSAMSKAVLEFAVPWKSEAARKVSGPLSVSIEAPKTMTTANLHAINAKITNTSEDRLRTLIIELPLPPGSFAPAPQFEDWKASGLIQEFEVMPTRVRLYVSEITGKGSLGFTYEIMPFLSGSVSLPPIRAYRFYVPEPVAESDGGDLRIVRSQ